MTLVTIRSRLRDGLTQVEVRLPDAESWEEVDYLKPRRCHCGEHDGRHPASTTPTTKAEQ